jgi:hypothetical protein
MTTFRRKIIEVKQNFNPKECNFLPNKLPHYLDASSNKEVDQDRFHLGLSALEVITTNERVFFHSVLNHTCAPRSVASKYSSSTDAGQDEKNG